MIRQTDLNKQINKNSILDEIALMKTCHPNIIKYIDSFLYQNNVWLVMEHMEGGTLAGVAINTSMSLGQISSISNKICMGIEHLHRHGIVHGAISSENVLFSLNGGVKLSGSILRSEGDHTDPACSRPPLLHPNLGGY